jgi:hypothetical protein
MALDPFLPISKSTGKIFPVGDVCSPEVVQEPIKVTGRGLHTLQNRKEENLLLELLSCSP